MLKKERNQVRSLIFFGSLIGFALNEFATFHFVLMTHPITIPLYLSIFILLLFLAQITYSNTAGLSKVRKAKYTFIGISLVSFLFTLWDIFQFYVLGEHYIKLSNEPPYLWLGGVPFPSFLISLMLGAFFNFLERFVETFETENKH